MGDKYRIVKNQRLDNVYYTIEKKGFLFWRKIKFLDCDESVIPNELCSEGVFYYNNDEQFSTIDKANLFINQVLLFKSETYKGVEIVRGRDCSNMVYTCNYRIGISYNSGDEVSSRRRFFSESLENLKNVIDYEVAITNKTIVKEVVDNE